MTKDKALQAWFEQFMTAYPTSSVPEDAVFPWLTYELVTGSWGSGEINMTVNLWFYTKSEEAPNAKAQEILDAIGLGGVFVHYDGGAMLLKRGSPECQSGEGENDKNVKLRTINILVEYLSQD